MKLNQNNGYTLIEFIIASGIAVAIGLAAFGVLTQSNKINQNFAKKIDIKIDTNIGKRFLIKDLKAASPSLNNIMLKDDNGLNFYDYEPDKTSSYFRAQTVLSRSLTLKQGDQKALYILVGDEYYIKSLFVEPIVFFELGATPSDITVATPLTYRGLDFNNYISTKAPKKLVEEKKLLIVDSSSFQYVNNPTKDIARPAVFIGRLVEKQIIDLEKIQFPESLFSYDIRLPEGKIVNPVDFERFLINLPPVGANGANIRIKSVKIIKYELKCIRDKCDLLRRDMSELDPAKEIQHTVDRDIKSVVFKRDSISDTVMRFEVYKN
jgi:hypothetical protein